MSKKVFLGVGHGGVDTGAVGYLVEKDINLTMALACKEMLEDYGVEVMMSRTCDEDDSLIEEINEANAYAGDLAVDIHNNAGGGDGFEVFHSLAGGIDETLAKNIESEVIGIGQNSRGCKTREGEGGADYYGFIRMINYPSIIVEGVFVDNETDVKIADTPDKQRAFGFAYARGILKTLGITEKPQPQPQPQPQNNEDIVDDFYRVQIGAFGIFENAVNRANEAISQGHEAIIKQYHDLYRVQVGAYKVRENAEDKLNTMISLGYEDAYITQRSGKYVPF